MILHLRKRIPYIVIRFAAGVFIGHFAKIGMAQVPDGFEVIQIAHHKDWARFTQMNNCGQVVFSLGPEPEGYTDIYIYDNGILSKITNGASQNWTPDISSDGTILWTANADGFGRGNIAIYRGGNQQTLGDGYHPSIAADGTIYSSLFFQDTGCAHRVDVLMWSGDSGETIFSDGRSNQSVEPIMAEKAIWTNYDFCVAPWESKILLYDGGQVDQMPTLGDPQVTNPDMNEAGLAGWGSNLGTEIYRDGAVTLLVGYGGGQPRINNLGHMYIHIWDLDIEQWQPWFYRDGEFYRLITDDRVSHVIGDINDDDEATWSSLHSPSGRNQAIWLMRRIRTGEADFDGDVDLDDYSVLAEGLNGPDFFKRFEFDPTVGLCDHRFLDIDYDNDIDLADFARFQNAFTGRR